MILSRVYVVIFHFIQAMKCMYSHSPHSQGSYSITFYGKSCLAALSVRLFVVAAARFLADAVFFFSLGKLLSMLVKKNGKRCILSV